jgi:hypothetical protein
MRSQHRRFLGEGIDAWQYSRISAVIFQRAARAARGLVVSAQLHCPGCPVLQRRQHDWRRQFDGFRKLCRRASARDRR